MKTKLMVTIVAALVLTGCGVGNAEEKDRPGYVPQSMTDVEKTAYVDALTANVHADFVLQSTDAKSRRMSCDLLAQYAEAAGRSSMLLGEEGMKRMEKEHSKEATEIVVNLQRSLTTLMNACM